MVPSPMPTASRHAAGDVIGIIVALGEQCQHAHLQDAFFELDLQGFDHALVSITRYLVLQDTGCDFLPVTRLLSFFP